MMSILAFAAAGAAIVWLFAVIIVRSGVKHEEREWSLRRRPDTISSAAARRLLGVYVRDAEDAGDSDRNTKDMTAH